MPQRSALGPEAQELAAFIGFFADLMGAQHLSPDIHPLNVLRELIEQSPRRILDGLKMAVNDCVEMACLWPADRVKAADDALRARNIVTLSEIRRRYSRQFAAVLRRGRISSETECYLVRGVLSDGAAPPDQAALLERMMSDYETKVVAKAKRGRERSDPPP